MRKHRRSAGILPGLRYALVFAVVNTASASASNIHWITTLNEDGTGSYIKFGNPESKRQQLLFEMAPDPTNPGLGNAPRFSLNPTDPNGTHQIEQITIGDVILTDSNGTWSDVIRFVHVAGLPGYQAKDGANAIFFYSLDDGDGLKCDVGLPPKMLDNAIEVPEGTPYIPGPKQPGGLATGHSDYMPYEYIFNSPEAVPEPSSLVLCFVALGVMITVSLTKGWCSR